METGHRPGTPSERRSIGRSRPKPCSGWRMRSGGSERSTKRSLTGSERTPNFDADPTPCTPHSLRYGSASTTKRTSAILPLRPAGWRVRRDWSRSPGSNPSGGGSTSSRHMRATIPRSARAGLARRASLPARAATSTSSSAPSARWEHRSSIRVGSRRAWLCSTRRWPVR